MTRWAALGGLLLLLVSIGAQEAAARTMISKKWRCKAAVVTLGGMRTNLQISLLCSRLVPAFLIALAGHASADPGTLTVKLDQPGIKMSPMFYGLMTEEINHSYDGGLYGELIQNRAFKDNPANFPGRGAPSPTTGEGNFLSHWSVVNGEGAAGSIALDTEDPVNPALSHSLRLDITSVGNGQRVGIANDGYWGIPLKPIQQYRGSFYAKAREGSFGPLTISIESADGATTYANAIVPVVTKEWKKYNYTFNTGQVKPTADTRFVISASKPGTVWFSFVSLFPPTYNNRPNGNRVDIMQLMADMKPSFLRFPGGNYVEGRNFEQRFNWKITIGPIDQRPGHDNAAWRYRSQDGMGLLEYLEWCEDLKMEPLLAVYAGLHLDGGRSTITGDALKPFVEEAVEEIEYVTGDARTTKWGAQRAKDGHPEPFKLTYVEIGNEDNLNNGMGNYDGRFTMFYDGIKAKYPSLQIISTVPSSNRNFARTRKPDVIDDHYYMSIQQSLSRVHIYDNYDRSGPRIFVGEWATRVGSPTPNMSAAFADAAWLTGLERNSDVVIMNCYAPLFVNVNPGAMQWPTDLIGYDSIGSYGSPSYYVQKMFSNNRGDTVVPVQIDGVAMLTPDQLPPAPAGRGGGRGGATQPAPAVEAVYSTASKTASGDVILKVVNVQKVPQQLQIDLQGVKEVDKNAVAEVLAGEPNDVNTVAEPTKVAPKKVDITDAGAKFTHEFPPYSVSVIRLKTK